MTPRPHALLVLLVLGAPGCLHTRNGRPEHTSSRNVEVHGPRDQAQPINWRRIVFGSGSSEQTMGFLRSAPYGAGIDATEIHTVYDLNMELRGRISPNGLTHRLDEFGEEQRLGSFTVEHALLTIWSRTDEVEVRLLPMPSPL
jgi:hypothetical protein